MLVGGATGVSTYAKALVAATRTIGARAMLLCDHDRGRLPRWRAALQGERRVVAAGDDRLAGAHLFRAAQVRFGLCRRFTTIRAVGHPPGIMHWTYPVPLRMAGWINIYTVHDMVPLDQPGQSPVDPVRLGAMLAEIAATADRIVTVSNASRMRILAHLDIDPRRVVNCYQALPEQSAARASLPAGLGSKGYFLFCGLTEPRKNIERLIGAHARSGTTLPLILVGPPTGDRATAAAIAAGVAAGRVRRLDYVSADLLATLQAQARALLFPSLGEGFGLPVVEAMRAGTPVLTSDRGALAEVAATAALLVDPDDDQAIAHGIARLETDTGLRHRLVEAGRRRAERFTQQRFAARLRAVYTDALRHASSDAW
jgi:glycosyltransferase involved in cell wall biosynthesis